MTNRAPADGDWWGESTIEVGQRGVWRMGALRLFVERHAGEWLLAHHSSDDETDTRLEYERTRELSPFPEEAEVKRFAVERPDTRIQLAPLLPDRPLVSLPEHPFHVLAGEKVRIFVSCPLWVSVQVGKKLRPLVEIPIYRSSDTWFGPNTREGELAYASRTRCRSILADLPRRPQRAVVPVVVSNRAEKTLVIERLSLPVPQLPLYRAADGGVWTSQVQVVVQEQKGQADIEIGKKPPEVGKGELLAEPRDPAARSMFTRALGAMIG
ncbi:MAG: hypothetical protein P1P84_17805 [Deferrisomatales bacterium]|nr:hypothetical protein [Deferrisomatales bacterium]